MTMPTEVHSVLISLAEDALLLPNTAVAEVVQPEAVRRSDSGPGWYLGQLDWGGLSVPVLRLDVLNGETAVLDERRARVLVLRVPARERGLDTLAILAFGYPHLVTLKPAAVRPEGLRDTDRADLVLARARVGTQSAWIPDFETLRDLVSGIAAA